MAKKRKKAKKLSLGFIALILVVAIAALAFYYFFVYKKQQDVPAGDTGDKTQTPEAGDIKEISSADLSIHFIAPAVKASGDCTLIKAGDTEVLIDAGPTQSNAKAIKEYINQYCTDGKLEYVIVTHGDTDHIAGMFGTSEKGQYNGILYSYEIGTLIQFDKTNLSEMTDKGNISTYGKYVEAVKSLPESTQVLNASQCLDTVYYLDEAQTISMKILNNYYYFNESKDENNYSVCMLLSQNLGEESKHYLFTGDLEEDGERLLVENNDLPKVELFKAGHHGSKTSSNDCLLSVIRPKYVAVCCCAGYNQYHASAENIFPTQAFIDRIANYTDKVYVTIQWKEDGNTYEQMNGDIVFYYGKGAEETEKRLKLWCSNNTTVLKDTDWFQKNRTWGTAG